jgi:hypothetical protein
MCFSATASFMAAGAMLGIGVMTLKSARYSRELPFAAIPFLFALQQLSEGVIWLTFQYDTPWVNTVMTYLYTVFSHVLWPIYVPIAVLLIEPVAHRRRTLLGFVIAGSVVGLYLLAVLVMFPVVSMPTGQHVEYILPHYFGLTTMTLYLMSTTISLILSTNTAVKVYGVLTLLSFVAVYALYSNWFISVWCFFAALLSAVVYLHFKLQIGVEKCHRQNV